MQRPIRSHMPRLDAYLDRPHRIHENHCLTRIPDRGDVHVSLSIIVSILATGTITAFPRVERLGKFADATLNTRLVCSLG